MSNQTELILEHVPPPSVVRRLLSKARREADCLARLIRVAERLHPPEINNDDRASTGDSPVGQTAPPITHQTPESRV